MRSLALTLSLLSAYVAATKIVISNDDGWATAQIRQQVDTLTSAGHDVSSLALVHQGAVRVVGNVRVWRASR